LSKLIRLENLSLHNIESKYLEEIFIHLISLPYLYSLNIKCTNHVQNKNLLCQQIFLLPVLKYCKLSLIRNTECNLLPIAINKFSPIEYLAIISKLYIDELPNILSYIPQIRRLSIHRIEVG
jgi:hypothetical protein